MTLRDTLDLVFLCVIFFVGFQTHRKKVKQQKLQLETEVRSFRNMVMMQTTFLKFQYCLAIQAKREVLPPLDYFRELPDFHTMLKRNETPELEQYFSEQEIKDFLQPL
ncbi:MULTISPECIES: hypothetical protein [Flectobacillus]|jgi:hypothetical protein|uniref:Uncharacterized protein n=1 Tax=Flectobacillus roseus TaxID=502259 RepID=A0ABT6Y380_9BACT|nr:MULTISPECIES: hypothetical protein [Flectobacillus]MDI9857919.1 hypothetical protein [Flectobacillus roseus]MDI9882458.1 hypothetical protein [Flectobacillus longus]NBA78843.1 hypothetical protein [Emticicia sp. ODNR4P]